MNCRTFQNALQDVFGRGWDQEQQDKDPEDEATPSGHQLPQEQTA